MADARGQETEGSFKILRQGYLRQYKPALFFQKSWHKRWFVLTTNEISYGKNEKDALRISLIFPLKCVQSVSPHGYKSKKFVIKTRQNEIYVLQADTSDLMAEWMREIAAAVKNACCPPKPETLEHRTRTVTRDPKYFQRVPTIPLASLISQSDEPSPNAPSSAETRPATSPSSNGTGESRKTTPNGTASIQSFSFPAPEEDDNDNSLRGLVPDILRDAMVSPGGSDSPTNADMSVVAVFQKAVDRLRKDLASLNIRVHVIAKKLIARVECLSLSAPTGGAHCICLLQMNEAATCIALLVAWKTRVPAARIADLIRFAEVLKAHYQDATFVADSRGLMFLQNGRFTTRLDGKSSLRLTSEFCQKALSFTSGFLPTIRRLCESRQVPSPASTGSLSGPGNASPSSMSSTAEGNLVSTTPRRGLTAFDAPPIVSITTSSDAMSSTDITTDEDRTERGQQKTLSSLESENYEDLADLTPEDIYVNYADESNLLGEGGFATIWKGYLRGDQEVAIKRCHPKNKNSKNFLREIATLKSLNHAHIMPFVGATVVSGEWLLVTEYCPGNSVEDYIENSIDPPPLEVRVKFAYETALGMTYLHDRMIAHLDIKPQNLVIGPLGEVKIGDFGNARMLKTESSELEVDACTVPYAAPEILTHARGGFTADIFSFGVILYRLIFLLQPYEDFEGTTAELRDKIVKEDIRPTLPSCAHIVQGYVQLMKDCWHLDPRLRPTSREVLARIGRLNETQKHLANWVPPYIFG
mmetsp:Transcript_30801/g.49828  ORF Transcript_30801/g.49828 Transcript_30801/m.49828 type:complete len:756 (-) Transcript_30801:173-2440(-)